jgi:RNA polymerase sigma-70 factor (ECF subfamily)
MDREVEEQGLAFEQFREYLHFLARQHLGEGWGKLEASDIVQQTLLEAHRKRDQFRGHTAAEMAAWLRQMLAYALADALRAATRAKRDVTRERSLEAALEQSSVRLEAWLAAEQSSPSQQANRNEQIRRLAEALERLPDAQREAVVLHYWQDWTVAAIGRHLGRTPAAVAGLLKRGLAQLRQHLNEEEQS